MPANQQGTVLRPRLGAGGHRRSFGLSCKEISIPVQPLLNHIPLNQVLGLQGEKQRSPPKPVPSALAAVTVAGFAAKPADEATTRTPPSAVSCAAKPRFGLPVEQRGELCPQCQLPLGELGYAVDLEGALVHGECKAQLILADMQKKDEARLKKDAALKRDRRAKYDLGWKVQQIPRNLPHAIKLGCSSLPQGLCAVAWRGEDKALAVVPTANPAASVNLEYLSLALRVRKQDGREPMFSLDPKFDESTNKHKLWQVKRFEPAWLDGTSAGEVMFQADYHLKELSMGEYGQPVTGMRSCFDFSEEQGLEQEWSAREWFVVNKAEIAVSKDGVMIPRVEMGVEARETIKCATGLQDVPMTRPDHPLVQYAESFTHFFELIAERKSVVHHLRELAKASVLAKFLVENNACMGEEWFSMADMSAGPSAHREIPQLWNEQRTSQIQVEEGRIMSSAEGMKYASTMHGVYGGVEMGIDQLQRVGVPVGRVPTAKVSMSRAPALSQRLIQARTGLAEMPLEVPGAAPGVPKGVDLNLDRFDLDMAAEAEAEVPEGSWAGEEFVGRAFWKNLSGPAFKEEDRAMLKALFTQHMSDRREDCEFFVPPDTSLAHVCKLRALIKEEASIRQRRQERFLSSEFAPENDTALFPGWRAPVGGQAVRLHARPEYAAEAANMVKNSAPRFCKSTEDGVRFCIYQLGSLEVRTVQELGSAEVVGAVFSSQEPGKAPTSATGLWSTIARTDKVAKAVLYVEHDVEAARYFATLETDHGDAIMVDMLRDGSLTWTESPTDLEARKAQAKALRAAECSSADVAVGELRARLGEAEAVAGGVCLRSIEAVLLMVLPAKEKAWASLAEPELALAQQLGVHAARAWDERDPTVFGLDWMTLSGVQRSAAKALGFDEASWRPAAAKNAPKDEQAQVSSGPWAADWVALSSDECQAAMTLGFTDEASWEVRGMWEALRREKEGVWEKSWAQLSEAERKAAIALGISGAGAWDEASWAPLGAWQRQWAQLSQDERQAAEELGVSAGAWDAAFGGAEKRGQGLAGVWGRSWAQLEQGERLAARKLGIMGAGAWDKSKAEFSVERKIAQLTKAEQEAMMKEWVKQTYGIGAEA
eukprot:CAMPEP_0171168378 /NCGR_PEP_ID=MMETSP0790-20130122/7679_1 /TAXON_ID=2925 /ORGANISM="Alexandrium catenella, Strain OF101" /LENGTH=1106 /DNA_ID=CAMNT_0011633215 /DNA_START=47 /DNA_END=3367 /DNA_ORIENTATION=+